MKNDEELLGCWIDVSDSVLWVSGGSVYSGRVFGRTGTVRARAFFEERDVRVLEELYEVLLG